ncbi:hypothetical protein HDU67_004817, partial [Dinochytrium kinnereticum]
MRILPTLNSDSTPGAGRSPLSWLTSICIASALLMLPTTITAQETSAITDPTLTDPATPTTTTTTAPVATLNQLPLPDAEILRRASSLLTFNINLPGGCLFQDVDLAGNPSRNLAALWLRALFHDAGTFDPATGTGGMDGSLESDAELALPDNTGLARSMATRFLINLDGHERISDADKIAMGAVVTVKHCGGPDVPFRPGRADSAPKTAPNDFTRLAADPFDSLANVTANFARMGFSKVDMLVLVAGSHTLGGVHKAITPKVTNETFVPFDDTPG